MLAQVDLGVTLTDGREVYEPGQPVRYTVVVTNSGPDAATAARVTNPLPTGTSGGSWTATYSPSATGPESGSGGLDATISLPAGGSAIFTHTVSVPASASGKLVGRATVAAGAGDTDANAVNDVAVDTDALPILVAANDAGADSTPEVTVINPFTGAVRHRFLAYERGFRGGVRVAVADVNADGEDEIVTASGSGQQVGEIRVFRQNGTELTAFRVQPYGGQYLGGIELAAADIDGDGDDDVVTTMSRGAGDVRVLRSEGNRFVLGQAKSFRPFADAFRGGATVAAADLNGDRKAEVILGSGPGAAPAVHVYAVTGKPTLVDNFRPFAADPGFTGGVSVAAARVNTDATPDIIVSGGRGAKSFFEVYDGRINAAVANASIVPRQAAFAGLARVNAAVALAMVDLDGDGRADRTFTAQGPGGEFAGVKATAAGAAPQLTPFTSPTLKSSLRLAASAPRLDAGLVTTPSGLRLRDLSVGTGAVATAGKNLEVHYVLSFPNGAVDQSSRTSGAVFSFKLGVGNVIEGWDEGVAGMKVGGRRQLIVPEHLAYKGQAGKPAGTLVFDVELKKVT
jgi:uncharacterized repeat protein (TIGR01451 family)